ncbi:Fc.00g078810.m01.CDS01 [Cosmosporella sp. VM-42]
MTVPSHFHMPGAFHGEGVHPGLFRPPMSPSASSSLSYAGSRSTATPSHDAHAKRKRHREEISRSQDDFSQNELDSDGFFATPVAQMRSEDRRYYLAGQLDTPNGGPFESGILGESMYSDSDYRRALGSKRPRDEMDSSMSGPTPLFNLPSQPTDSKGWGSFAFNTLGGVVGRVWEFCKTGAFRGFYAGGGTGFRMSPVGIKQMAVFEEQPIQDHQIPGRFPLVQAYPSYPSNPIAPEPEDPLDSGATTPTGPAAKRRHTDRQDDLGRNWVMVGDSATPDRKSLQRRPPFRPSPRSRNQAPSMATGRRISTPTSRLSSSAASNSRRPSSRLSLAATSPSIPPPRASTASTASTASFASPRSPSPSKIPQPTLSRRRSTITHSPTPSLSHRRTNSAASTASSRIGKDGSPRLDPEAKRLAARRNKDEREADVRMSALNKQLQDMIRQGKEALGTTFEVEGNWDDE